MKIYCKSKIFYFFFAENRVENLFEIRIAFKRLLINRDILGTTIAPQVENNLSISVDVGRINSRFWMTSSSMSIFFVFDYTPRLIEAKTGSSISEAAISISVLTYSLISASEGSLESILPSIGIFTFWHKISDSTMRLSVNLEVIAATNFVESELFSCINCVKHFETVHWTWFW